MNKSSFINNKVLDKSNIAVICIFGMGIGFLTSVVILSIFTFLFGINAIRDVSPRYWIRNKWWVVCMCWVLMYALSYFWSIDKTQWGIRLQTKLPFLILPLAVAYLPSFNAKQLKQITVAVAVVLLLSAFYSLSFFLRDPAFYTYGYLFSRTMPTRPDDHIRVSLIMVLFIIWTAYVWPLLEGRPAKWFIACAAVFLVVFIHILAVKSGLIALYTFLVGWGIYTAFAGRKLIGIVVLIAIPICFLLAINFVPTLKERVGYTYYSYDMLKSGDKSGNYGDLNRLMSYKIAMMFINEHPWTGIGTGDMQSKMAEGYQKLYPEVAKQNVLLPHNQFLIVALGCGIPAMLIFAIAVFMPLARIRKNRQSFFFFIVWLTLLLQLMIDPVLEVQYGVFVYLFFLVLFMHELPDGKPAN